MTPIHPTFQPILDAMDSAFRKLVEAEGGDPDLAVAHMDEFEELALRQAGLRDGPSRPSRNLPGSPTNE